MFQFGIAEITDDPELMQAVPLNRLNDDLKDKLKKIKEIGALFANKTSSLSSAQVPIQ